jgi:tetratricopeptide (TPR) repeat protein
MSPALEVVGRESEIDSVHDFLEAVPAGPITMLIEGEIGIGKTTLWREGVAAADERGLQVLACMPFAALGDLLEGVPEDVLARLPEPQREALEIALLRVETRPGRLRGRAVALGVLGAFRVLAEDSPLVVAIDDVQWLDAPSADALTFAARRLRGEAIGFLVARRADAREGPLEPESALESGRVWRLLVHPLDLQSLDRLLRTRLDKAFLRPALVELQRVSGGNPFFALELARALLARDVSLAPGDPLPVPPNLHELVRERLAVLPAAAREAALVVSALSRPTVALVAAAATRGDGEAALEKAEAAGVVELAHDRIRFSHPLLASVVYAQAPGSRRRALHARLAEIVDDADERARHLALAATGPDPQVAAAVDDAARRAWARGASQAAAELWERARRLTPPDDAEGWRRAVEAAECHLEAGDTDRARVLLEDVVARLPPGPGRAGALTRLAWVGSFGRGFHVGADLFRAALAEIGDDLALRTEIERGLAWSIHEIGDMAAAEAHARAALEMAERLGEPALLASALADMAFFETVRGRGIPTALIERALELERKDEWRPFLGRFGPVWIQAVLLEWAGDLDAARSTLEALRQSMLAQGEHSEHSVNYLAFQLGRVECLAGNWELAARYAEECFEATLQTGQEDHRRSRRSSTPILGVWPKRVPRPTRGCPSRSTSESYPRTSRCSGFAASSSTRSATRARHIASSAHFLAPQRKRGTASRRCSASTATRSRPCWSSVSRSRPPRSSLTWRGWAPHWSACGRRRSRAAAERCSTPPPVTLTLRTRPSIVRLSCTRISKSRSSAGARFWFWGHCSAGAARSAPPGNR